PAVPEAAEEKPPTWFWDLLGSLPREQWGSKYSVLGWRLEPKVPGLPGAKGFLFEEMQPITISFFKQNYGGGKFRCVLQENSRFKTTHDFDIEGNPKYDLTRENPNGVHGNAPAAAANNGNADFQKEFISVLREELARSRTAGQETTQGTDKVVEM